MDRRDLERVGKCCAQCWTPYMCGRSVCHCHGDSTAQCRFCGTRLFVPPPRPPSFRDVLTAKVAA